MTSYTWRVTNGDLGLAADWYTAQPTIPSAIVPGSADTVTFSSTGGTLTGTLSVLQANFNAGAAAPWTLTGALTTGSITSVSALALSAGSRLTLSGRPNSNAAFLPFSGTLDGPVTVSGATLDSSGGQLSIGAPANNILSQTGALTVNGGGTARALGLNVGSGRVGALIVTGAGSTYASVRNTTLETSTSGSGYLSFGQNTTVNGLEKGAGTLTLDAGGAVSVDNGLNLGVDAGASGVATVANGAVLTIKGGSLNVGANNAGGAGTLTVNAGGTVVSTQAPTTSSVLRVGGTAASGTTLASTGSVVVQGTGALLDLGGSGANIASAGLGTLSILSGGTAKFGTPDPQALSAFNVARSGGTGTVTVDGVGSLLQIDRGATFGQQGSAHLVVQNGGKLLETGSDITTDYFIIGQGGTATNTAFGGASDAVVKSGGVLMVAAPFSVGRNVGGNGTLTVGPGGTVIINEAPSVSVYALQVGNTAASAAGAGSTGAVVVSGAGALLDVQQNGASVGLGGSGTVSLSGGGIARSASTDSRQIAALAVGRDTGAIGTLTVSGAGSSYDAAGFVYVGRAGSGTLVVDQGGSFVGGSAATGDSTGANQAFSVVIGDGSPTFDVNGVPISPLYFGGTGAARVTNGSTLRSRGNLTVGNRGTAGTLLVDTGSVASSDRSVTVGDGTDRIGGAGTVIVQGGGTVRAGGQHLAATAGVSIGNQAGTMGTVTVTGAGSLLDANGDRLSVGARGTGTLLVQAGASAQSGSALYATPSSEAGFSVGNVAGGNGTATIDGAGSKLVVNGTITVGGTLAAAGGSGTLAASNGGVASGSALTLWAGGTIRDVTGGTILVGGGTAAAGAGLLIQTGAAVTAHGGRIEGAVTLNGTLSNDGSLIVAGAVSGGGTVSLGAGSTTEFTSLLGGKSISFGGAFATLKLDSFSGTSTITAAQAGDTIDLVGITGAVYAGGKVQAGANTLTIAGVTVGTSVALSSDGAGGTKIAFYDPLFDAAYYLAKNPDVAAAGVDPYQHYINSGFREGRDPSALFSTSYYLSNNPDIAAAGINPLLHFEASGYKEGRNPSALFSDADYLAANPDVKAAGFNPLLHYVLAGKAEGRAAYMPGPIDPGVDAAYYYATNPDVKAAGLDAAAHYHSSGYKEGRNPNAFFDTKYYLTQNPDVAAAGVDPLAHFEASGYAEGREPSLLFSDAKYLAANPDVKAAGLNPLLHYLRSGQAEGRIPFLTGGTAPADPLIDAAFYDKQLGATLIPTGVAAAQQAAFSYDTTGWQGGLNPDAFFDTKYYLTNNPDVRAAGIDPLKHFEVNGWKEGRNPSAQFSTNKYIAAYSDVKAAGIDPLLHFVVNGQSEGRTAFSV